MALQPQEEPTEYYAPYEYTDVETSQHSQNIPQYPVTTFVFSPITTAIDPSLAPSASNIFLPSSSQDWNEIVKDFSISPDLENNINDMVDAGEFGLEEFQFNDPNDWLEQELEDLDKRDLQNLDQSIKDRTMSVETQPPTNIRRRYQSDGKRQIEKSRSKPMAIKLPDLQCCALNSHQSLWIQLILITSDNNPAKKVYIHVDKIEYHEKDLPECDHKFVRIPLAQADIQAGIKQLARVSIIKTKLDTYAFELIPFNPISNKNPVEIYKNQSAKSVVAEAKCFRNTYNLKSSRIACQLLIKQNETWYTTDIVCETDIMEEKDTQYEPNKSNKRLASSNDSDDDDDDEYQVHQRNSAKKQKRSPTLTKGLPVTRVN